MTFILAVAMLLVAVMKQTRCLLLLVYSILFATCNFSIVTNLLKPSRQIYKLLFVNSSMPSLFSTTSHVKTAILQVLVLAVDLSPYLSAFSLLLHFTTIRQHLQVIYSSKKFLSHCKHDWCKYHLISLYSYTDIENYVCVVQLL